MVGLGSTMDAFPLYIPGGRPISIGFICVGIYFLVSLVGFDVNASKNNSNARYVFLPLLYLFVLWVSNLAHANSDGLHFPSTIFLNWLLMFFVLRHALLDDKATTCVLNGISIGAIILTILFFNGIGIETVPTSDGDRITLLGMNSNDLCITESIGLIFLLNEAIFKDEWHLKGIRWLLLILVILEIMMVLAIASRTGTVIVFAAIVISIFVMKGVSKTTKLLIILVGISALVLGSIYMFETDSIIANRMKLVIEEGDTSGRTYIWRAYLQLFPEHPLFGVGETGLIDVCRKAGLRTVMINGHEAAFSPHNVLVELLMTSGLLGLCIMLRFWWMTFKNGFLDYRNKNSSTAVVLVIPLVIVILSGQVLTSKIAWAIYAYLISRGYQNNAKIKILRK